MPRVQILLLEYFFLVRKQRTCTTHLITLPGYNFSSQAIDVPLETKYVMAH
jgi:hypothetical protein